jgi:hypothetical protein
MQEQQHSHTANIAGSDAHRAEIGGAIAGGAGQEEQIVSSPRNRPRRRVRFLRKARELAYRDLGGLVFNLHRFVQRNDPLVVAKLSMLDRIDAELRALESALEQRQPVTVLREAGIIACPRCAAIHGSEDRFCPNCGLPVGRHADLPIASASSPPANGPAGAPPAVVQAEAPSPPAPEAAAAAAPPPASPSVPDVSATLDVSPAPTSPAGRSPSPPPASSPAPASAPAQDPPEIDAQASSVPPGQDEPTEILRPPTVGK